MLTGQDDIIVSQSTFGPMAFPSFSRPWDLLLLLLLSSFSLQPFRIHTHSALKTLEEKKRKERNKSSKTNFLSLFLSHKERGKTGRRVRGSELLLSLAHGGKRAREREEKREV